jgi:large subunit ribosomal protein L25
MKFEVIATSRNVQGTGASRRLRRDGKVPAIVYGADLAPINVELDHNSVFHQLKREAFHASILSLVLDGQEQKVLLRDVQYHPFKPLVLHVDFQRVAADQKIHMRVPLHFVNGDVCPGVKLQGGSINHILTDVEVSCLPGQLPEFIEVDLIGLTAGHSLHLADLKLPEGVELVALNRGENFGVAALVGAKAE